MTQPADYPPGVKYVRSSAFDFSGYHDGISAVINSLNGTEAYAVLHELIHDAISTETPDGALLRIISLMGAHDTSPSRRLGAQAVGKQLSAASSLANERGATYCAALLRPVLGENSPAPTFSEEYAAYFDFFEDVFKKTELSSWWRYLVASTVITWAFSSERIGIFLMPDRLNAEAYAKIPGPNFRLQRWRTKADDIGWLLDWITAAVEQPAALSSLKSGRDTPWQETSEILGQFQQAIRARLREALSLSLEMPAYTIQKKTRKKLLALASSILPASAGIPFIRRVTSSFALAGRGVFSNGGSYIRAAWVARLKLISATTADYPTEAYSECAALLNESPLANVSVGICWNGDGVFFAHIDIEGGPGGQQFLGHRLNATGLSHLISLLSARRETVKAVTLFARTPTFGSWKKACRDFLRLVPPKVFLFTGARPAHIDADKIAIELVGFVEEQWIAFLTYLKGGFTSFRFDARKPAGQIAHHIDTLRPDDRSLPRLVSISTELAWFFRKDLVDDLRAAGRLRSTERTPGTDDLLETATAMSMLIRSGT